MHYVGYGNMCKKNYSKETYEECYIKKQVTFLTDI